MRVLDRDVVFSALTGSWNYNLQQTEEAIKLGFKPSDKDYKVFVAPTFEELYKGKMYSKTIITDSVDQDIHDIRKLPELLWKSNIVYLESLFSEETWGWSEIGELVELREEIARMNLAQLFKSTGGMYHNRMKKIGHATEGTKHLVDAFGYNTKEAMHTFRSINLLVRYEQTNFTDFKSALRYDDSTREFVLGIKNGDYSEAECISFLKLYHDNHFAPLKDKFLSYKSNEELKIRIEEIVMDLVESIIKLNYCNKG